MSEVLFTKDELNNALQKLSIHIEKSPLAVIDWDTDFCVSAWNPAAESIFGFSKEEAIGQHASFIIPVSFHRHIDSVWNALLDNHGGTRSTNKNITKAGDELSCEWYNTPVVDESGKVISVCSFAQDISEQVAYLESLHFQANHDELTSLYNRQWLIKYIDSSIKQRPDEGFHLYFIDLDRFKEINDTLGHHVGDSMLITLSRRLNESAKSKNNKVVRLGGDEFALVTINNDVVAVVNSILQDLEKPIEISGMKLEVGASIGVACYPEHGGNSASLMRCADIAMYKAKQTNNSYMQYSKDIDNHSSDRLMLMNDLRSAIYENQLVLHFQPKINIQDNSHFGYEALLRWNHPTRGLVSPAEFIPFAEVSSLIHPLTMWVLDNSMRQSREWSEQGFNYNISINLSTRNLLDESLPDDILILLNKYGVDPATFEIEVTESAVMTEPKSALRTLQRLFDLGVIISIDDFGTGYSSLSYLRKMPIHKLKIDQSFVKGMGLNQEDRIIVESTINLAHNLGLKVVAEGVENKEVLEILYELGCDEAQGYYISHPLPIEEVKKLVFKLSEDLVLSQ